MAAATLSLSQMVDLALGTPEVGAVNFNVLHSLLHAVLHKLNISGVQADINEEDRQYLSKRRDDIDTTVSESGVGSEIGDDSSITSRKTTGSEKEKSAPSASSHEKTLYHVLQDKVSHLEHKLEALNKLPSNTELIDRTRSKESQRPVSAMWQTMQTQKRVDANEEGVSKLMSLVQDLMEDMNRLREENSNLLKQLEKLESMNNMGELMDKLKALDELTKELNNKFNNLPKPKEVNLEPFVTWESLESALRGIRADLEPKERVVIEMCSQTDPQSRASTPGPSQELIDILEKLGLLSDRHDSLDGRVTTLEEQMKTKCDRDELKNALDALEVGVPDDLLAQMKALRDDMDALMKHRDKDSDALSRIQQALHNLQSEVERLGNVTSQIVDDNNNKTIQIEELYSLSKSLEEKKADKEFVQLEIEPKADKRQLDGKVNRSVFDSTCDELSRMINDILNKLSGHEDEWRKALINLTNELEGKLDRLELDPLKDWLEKQLKLLSQRMKQTGDYLTDDEAAGLRKQLIQKFHCISCDRPVDMLPQGAVPSIPGPGAIQPTRSIRPYTTFELDQIRQQAKSYNPESGQDVYATNRPCGGTHTLTYPHRRITRMSHMSTLFRDEVDGVGLYKEEMDVQGADGHIYKGRLDSKLPTIQTPIQPGIVSSATDRPQPSVSPKVPRRAFTDVGQHETVASAPPTAPGSVRLPDANRTSRPTSGRVISRPQSARTLSRPQSSPHDQRATTPARNNTAQGQVEGSQQEPPPPRTPTPVQQADDNANAQ